MITVLVTIGGTVVLIKVCSIIQNICNCGELNLMSWALGVISISVVRGVGPLLKVLNRKLETIRKEREANE